MRHLLSWRSIDVSLLPSDPTKLKLGRTRAMRVRRWAPIALAASTLASPISMAAESVPKRGGTLEFAVTVEPDSYDCHSNTSFAWHCHGSIAFGRG
jgi:hypothetical protein